MNHQPHLAVEYRQLAALKPYAGNARRHPAAQIRQLSRLIREVGFLVPILIDADGTVIAGHGRIEAAQSLGMTTVPTIAVEHLTPAQLKAFRIADNRLAENSDWDSALLSVEIKELLTLDFDVDLLGFETGELDVLIRESGESPVPPPAMRDETVSQLGDIFQTSSGHRIACGDSRDAQVVAGLMQGTKARMVLSDPPFNVPIEGHVGGLGKHHHPEFAMASGEMSDADFLEFLTRELSVAQEWSVEGALLYFFMDWRHIWQLHEAATQLGLGLVNLAVWDKGVGGMGSLYRSQHELILILKKGKKPHLNNVQLGKHGRYRTNVWAYSGANSFGAGRDEALAAHPTMKPTALLRDAILDCTKPKDIVFDGFIGSGSTMLAAEQARRRCYGVEIDPRYVDVALRRWIAGTGQQPVHVASGLTFEQLQRDRQGKNRVAMVPAKAQRQPKSSSSLPTVL